MLKTNIYCLATLFLLALAPCEASLPGDGNFETISITADVAREDIEPGILHFEGHFTMQTADWHIESIRATVYGHLERPDKVHLQGSPARFLINRDNLDDEDIVEATAPEMEYHRSTSILKLSGGAVLKLDDEVIQSAVIEYNVDTERYRAGGAAGVFIEVPPVD
jgi:lipopolysaccharide transport protein LptA